MLQRDATTHSYCTRMQHTRTCLLRACICVVVLQYSRKNCTRMRPTRASPLRACICVVVVQHIHRWICCVHAHMWVLYIYTDACGACMNMCGHYMCIYECVHTYTLIYVYMRVCIHESNQPTVHIYVIYVWQLQVVMLRVYTYIHIHAYTRSCVGVWLWCIYMQTHALMHTHNKTNISIYIHTSIIPNTA